MRRIGSIKEHFQAKTFSDYLYTMGIPNDIREGEDGWDIWVHDEDQLQMAKANLADYMENPNDPVYASVGKKAKKIKRKEKQENQKAATNRVDIVGNWQRNAQPIGLGMVTTGFIFICVVVALLSELGKDHHFLNYLFISSYKIKGQYIEWPGLLQIKHGEIWRLLTPIFIHFGFLHILFNMLWLKDLGSMVEQRQSPWHLLFLTIIIGVGANLAQYAVAGPSFGGMSGVVYGLLGYIWMRGKHDPACGLFLHEQTIMFMIVWFFVCLFGLIGGVANTAHGVGLVMGMAWGYISSGKLTRRFS